MRKRGHTEHTEATEEEEGGRRGMGMGERVRVQWGTRMGRKIGMRRGRKLERKAEMKMETNQITEIIVDAAFQVHRALGPGLLESVYEVVLADALRSRGLKVERQK